MFIASSLFGLRRNHAENSRPILKAKALQLSLMYFTASRRKQQFRGHSNIFLSPFNDEKNPAHRGASGKRRGTAVDPIGLADCVTRVPERWFGLRASDVHRRVDACFTVLGVIDFFGVCKLRPLTRRDDRKKYFRRILKKYSRCARGQWPPLLHARPESRDDECACLCSLVAFRVSRNFGGRQQAASVAGTVRGPHAAQAGLDMRNIAVDVR